MKKIISLLLTAILMSSCGKNTNHENNQNDSNLLSNDEAEKIINLKISKKNHICDLYKNNNGDSAGKVTNKLLRYKSLLDQAILEAKKSQTPSFKKNGFEFVLIYSNLKINQLASENDLNYERLTKWKNEISKISNLRLTNPQLLSCFKQIKLELEQDDLVNQLEVLIETSKEANKQLLQIRKQTQIDFIETWNWHIIHYLKSINEIQNTRHYLENQSREVEEISSVINSDLELIEDLFDDEVIEGFSTLLKLFQTDHSWYKQEKVIPQYFAYLNRYAYRDTFPMLNNLYSLLDAFGRRQGFHE